MQLQVVELLNQTQLLTKDSQKITNLKQVQELIVNKEPTLLDNFLDVSGVVHCSLFFVDIN